MIEYIGFMSMIIFSLCILIATIFYNLNYFLKTINDTLKELRLSKKRSDK